MRGKELSSRKILVERSWLATFPQLTRIFRKAKKRNTMSNLSLFCQLDTPALPQKKFMYHLSYSALIIIFPANIIRRLFLADAQILAQAKAASFAAGCALRGAAPIPAA